MKIEFLLELFTWISYFVVLDLPFSLLLILTNQRFYVVPSSGEPKCIFCTTLWLLGTGLFGLVIMASSTSRGIQIGSAWFQRKLNLRPQHRGVHLVTEEILRQMPEMCQFSVGLCHVQILHTSASLALNESWDPDVRDDMEMMLNKIVPEGLPYRHSCEGPDDMPAHVKACFLGSSLTIPISEGKLNLGMWQGIWLCEHRDHAGSRKLVVTLNGVLGESGKMSPLSPGSPMVSTSS